MVNNKKIRVAVLMGGVSSEREVSLATGKTIAKNLAAKKYSVKTYDTKTRLMELISDLSRKKIDVVFIALHGKYGEDGTVQGFLELFGVPYTGCGVLASALAMDKQMAKKILRGEDILVPMGFLIDRHYFLKEIVGEIKRKIGLPCVIKPNDSGSSVGVTITKKSVDISRAVKIAFQDSDKVLIEKYLKGTELTVPVLGNDELTALPVVEICPKEEFFDYKAKYTTGACEEIVPARISTSLTKKVQAIALKTYQALGCRGFARVDMILKGNKIYVLEANTIPGMTPNSLLPKSAQAAGISFPKLLDKIIGLALE